jgi:hypothetical protein
MMSVGLGRKLWRYGGLEVRVREREDALDVFNC